MSDHIAEFKRSAWFNVFAVALNASIPLLTGEWNYFFAVMAGANATAAIGGFGVAHLLSNKEWIG